MARRRKREGRTGVRSRRFDDRGAGLLEMALVTPVFFLFIFGILEFGFAFRAYLAVSDATNEAARIGALQGPATTTEPSYTADRSIVSALRQGTASLELEEIESIVIFKGHRYGAGSPMQQVPQACKSSTTSIAGACNVYPAQEAFYAVQAADEDYFTCSGSNERPCGWNPTARGNGPAMEQIDYLGVYIRYRHPYMTGMFGEALTFESAAVLRLEPGPVQ